MLENSLIAFVAAVIALILRELAEFAKKKKKSKNIAGLCVEHLKKIQSDLREHVVVQNGSARFNETQYCEIVVGDFLYDLFTSNIDSFSNLQSIKKTTNFFHHYKVNMSTVKSRMNAAGQQSANLTEGTYNNLSTYLQEAIDELSNIAGT